MRAESPAPAAAPAVALGLPSAAAPIVETERLVLRELERGDAAFILELLNEPDWKRFIGDKGVHTLEAAERYIEDGPRAMYARVGFGLHLVARKDTGEPLGICGLIRREGLPDVDIGFAFLERSRGFGYAEESARAVLAWGARERGLARVVAIVSPGNQRSERLLAKLGFRNEGAVTVGTSDEVLTLFAASLS